MKRVLIISYYWPPSGGAGVQRWLKFSKFLPEFGWEPVVLTVKPEDASYPVLDETLNKDVDGKIRVVRTESREWFSVYKKVSGEEKIPYAGFANEKKKTSFKQIIARFIRGNFFLPDPRKGWNKYALQAARTLLAEKEYNCIVTTSPPHSTQLIGLALSSEFSIPWIADLRDPWTDIYYYKQFYPGILAHKYNLRLEKHILEKASAVTTVGPSLQSLFSDKIDTGKEKIRILTNGFDSDDFDKLPGPSSREFIITYVGTIADNYPLQSFLLAFREFIQQHPGAKLRFIGTISQEHLSKLKKLPAENIEIIPYVIHRSALEYMSSSNVLLLIIPDHKDNKGIVTGKIFEYLAVGRPVLFLGPRDGDGAQIIRSGNSGAVIDPYDQDSIALTLNEWKQSPPHTVPNNEYTREKITMRLVELMEELIH